MSEERSVRVSIECCFVKIHKSGVFSISSQKIIELEKTMSTSTYDKYSCIGGEGWYWVRDHYEIERLGAVFCQLLGKCNKEYVYGNSSCSSSVSGRLSDHFRRYPRNPTFRGKEKRMYMRNLDSQRVVFENMKNFTLRSSAGTIRSRGDFKFETANFQVRIGKIC